MKCPHCKYVSFEHLDTCRKCSKDLSAHKSQYGIDYLAPIPLGILTFVATGSASAGEPVSEEMSFDTSDVVIGDEESVEEEVMVDFGADSSEDEAQFTLDESIEEEPEAEVIVEEVAEEPEMIAEDVAEEPEVELEESAEAVDEEPVFEVGGMEDSDTGFSLGLGDDLEGEGEGLDFGSMDDSDSGIGEEISLGFDDSGAEEKELSISIDEEAGDDTGGEEELSISLGEVAGDEEPSLGIDGEGLSSELEVNISDEPETGAVAKPAPSDDDDFPDIELSLDDKEIFGEDGDGSDDDLDLGGLDLEMTDD